MNTTNSKAENFNRLYTTNVNDKVEKKGNLTYLSWSYAWAEFKKTYPDATYRVLQNPVNNMPYFEDPNMGVMVFTEVKADDLTYTMWLPVMDSSNRAMKSIAYTYTVFNKYKNAEETKTVEAATMFDVNKTIMRCLVKNLAMFGLGLYIYNGEDLPEDSNSGNGGGEEPKKTTTAPKRSLSKITTDRYAGIRNALRSVDSMDTLVSLYNMHRSEVEGNPEIKAMFSTRKNELLIPA